MASILFTIISSILWFPVMFCTIGLLAGLYAYNYYFKQQYYFYHNLGFTKIKLNIMALCINAVVAIPLFVLFLFIR